MKTHVDIDFAGKSYRLTPSPRLLMDMSAVELDPLKIMMAIEAGAEINRPVPLKVVVDVLYLAMQADGHEVEREAFWQMCHAKGLMELFEPFAALISGLINKGQIPDIDLEEPEPPDNRHGRRKKKAAAKKAVKKTTNRKKPATV